MNFQKSRPEFNVSDIFEFLVVKIFETKMGPLFLSDSMRVN